MAEKLEQGSHLRHGYLLTFRASDLRSLDFLKPR